MASLIRVTCESCEGTGQKVDHFNPPLHGYFDKPHHLYIQTTLSGHRIIGGTCSNCGGKGYDFIIRGSYANFSALS